MNVDKPGRDKPLPYRGKIVVRTIGSVLLSACAVMLVLGCTVLADELRGRRFVLYWSWCFVITAAAILVALGDMLMIRRASKHTRRQIFRDHFMTGELAEKLRKKDGGEKH